AMAPTASRPVALRAVILPGGLGAHKWRDRRLLDDLGDDPVPLLVEPDGTVLEAAFANVWLLRGDRLVTPPADGRILPGVTRALLLACAAGLGLSAVEEHVSVEDLRGADAVILTSAARLAVAAALDAAPAEPSALARIRAALGAS
ncbi:MAG: aminotransferase class IV, partial [Solirubrobacteraceae bacterium]